MFAMDELSCALRNYVQRFQAEVVYQLSFGTQVVFVQHAGELELLMDAFLAEDSSFMGLDTEWSTGQQVALVQICLGSRVLLLRPETLRPPPQRLAAALANPSVLKCGVGIAQDLRLLEQQCGLEIRGALELSALAVRHGHVEKGLGLAGICYSVLGKTLPKDHAIRCSEWAADLSQAQMHYAACDATVAVDIACRLYERYADQGSSPVEWCCEFVDRLKLPKNRKLCVQTEGAALAADSSAHRLLDKVQTRSRQLYDDCKQLAPDGTHIAFVTRKRAEWYVRKGLAMLVSEEPFEFQLLFEPKGRSTAAQGPVVMQNRCVGCGEENDLVRFCVVPHAFRSLLQSEIAARSHHDIVLLCRTCFAPASMAVSRRRDQLFQNNNVSASACKYIVDDVRKAAAKAAQVLLACELPFPVRVEKLAVVRALLGKPADEDVSRHELELVSTIEFQHISDSWRSPAEQVVAALRLSEGEDFEQRCQDFVVSWREDFIKAVRPQFLPAGWDVNRRSVER